MGSSKICYLLDNTFLAEAFLGVDFFVTAFLTVTFFAAFFFNATFFAAAFFATALCDAMILLVEEEEVPLAAIEAAGFAFDAEDGVGSSASKTKLRIRSPLLTRL